MSFNTQETNEILKISGVLDISGADVLRDALASYLERCSVAKVDLSEVESCDPTALQLFYSARKSAKGRHQSFEITGVSKAMKLVCLDLGVNLDELIHQ